MSQQAILTIGNFDGLHKGHIKLIGKVLSLSEKYKLPSVVCSFDINTKNTDDLIFPQNQLSIYLKELGVTRLKKLKFYDIKKMSCEQFVREIIIKEFKAKYVIIGENFHFGKNKSGNARTLLELGAKYGFKTQILTMAKKGERDISSSLIREYLKNGKIEAANKLTYRNFSLFGNVKAGFKMGAKLSYPTANLDFPKKSVILKSGVYKTRALIDGCVYNSVTNVGTAPINPKKKPVIETYIFDFDKDIYEKRINITFLKYIRNERKFKSFELLKKQIERDIAKAKED